MALSEPDRSASMPGPSNQTTVRRSGCAQRLLALGAPHSSSRMWDYPRHRTTRSRYPLLAM